MREIILISIICVIANKVTAPAPFHSPNPSSPYPKSTTPPVPKLPTSSSPYPKSTAPPVPKLPKWSDYNSKNSALKPMKDNVYLASLVKKPPNKIKNDTKNAEHNKTKIEELKCLNVTKVLFADEIESPSNGKETREVKTIEIKSLEDPKIKSNATEPRKGMKLHELFKPLTIKKVNSTENQNKTFEIPPTMIPIFRPKPNPVKSQISMEDLAIISSVPNSAATAAQDLPASVENADKAIPSSEAQPNLILNMNAIPFNIPCHKASDVLDEVPAKPEISRASHANLNPIPEAINPVLQEPNQVEKPDKLETDESVAIIFKPKNISLLNVYGDLLKKITLTVLVPYHISKLGT